MSPFQLGAVGLLLASSIFGCAATGAGPSTTAGMPLADQADALAASLRVGAPTEGGGVVVRLAFGADADLDLYVTDPLLDTVYFARHETRTGGRIEADVRCDSTGPRIEEVRFEDPLPGRYRIGIDYPRACDGASESAAYAVAAYASGESYTTQGSVTLERFEVVVLEFDVQQGSER
jgi:hypothetical protein